MKEFCWFQNEYGSYLIEYDVKYRYFKEGDFGELYQVEFNSSEKGGEIDFWSLGWLNVHFINYTSGDVLLNVLLKPEQTEEKNEVLKKLKELL